MIRQAGWILLSMLLASACLAAPKGSSSHSSPAGTSGGPIVSAAPTAATNPAATTAVDTTSDTTQSEALHEEFRAHLRKVYPSEADRAAVDVLAQLAVEAISTNHTVVIGGLFPFLSTPATGNPAKDELLRIAARDVAFRYFPSRVSVQTTGVLVTGLDATATKSINKEIPRATKEGMQPLARMIAASAGNFDAMAAALRPFSGGLLVIVAHHDAVKGEVEFGDDQARTVPVKVSDLISAARQAGVGLLILGCQSAKSGLLGPSAALDVAEVTESLKRVFSVPYSNFGEFMQQVSSERFRMTIDLRFTSNETISIVDRNSGKVLGHLMVAVVVNLLARSASAPDTSAIGKSSRQSFGHQAKITADALMRGMIFGAAGGAIVGFMLVVSHFQRSRQRGESIGYAAKACLQLFGVTVGGVGLAGVAFMALAQVLSRAAAKDGPLLAVLATGLLVVAGTGAAGWRFYAALVDRRSPADRALSDELVGRRIDERITALNLPFSLSKLAFIAVRNAVIGLVAGFAATHFAKDAPLLSAAVLSFALLGAASFSKGALNIARYSRVPRSVRYARWALASRVLSIGAALAGIALYFAMPA